MVLGGFQRVPPFWMSSNFQRFQEILNQKKSEIFRCISHVKPRNLPRSPKPWARWLVLLWKNDNIFFNILPVSMTFLSSSKSSSLLLDRSFWAVSLNLTTCSKSWVTQSLPDTLMGMLSNWFEKSCSSSTVSRLFESNTPRVRVLT